MRAGQRVRIDRLLVDKGLVESREKAARHLLAGDVFVDGERVDKAGALVAPGGGGTAWFAHIGGFLAGMVLLFLIRPRRGARL